MAVNQVRRRKRPIPSVPPPLSEPDVTAPRYYCPGCGQVRPEGGVGERESAAVVMRHYIYRSGPWPKGDEYKIGESLAKEICPGGVIDLVKDRAP
ncbi:hypothetical protein [Streptomyces sp. OK228]|uniref:hypothetical protein n=1 Tax=Streptomyces sp. OK228 TaxID=1882786 RepID=UPI00117FEBA7|nr:hypothetical protein [Streptomyces sp. OK228]